MTMTLEAYKAIAARMEPEVGMVDPCGFYVSAAISLKRIADALQMERGTVIAFYDKQGGTHLLRQVNTTDSRNVYRGTIGEVILLPVDAK